jgi:hypothetical protein
MNESTIRPGAVHVIGAFSRHFVPGYFHWSPSGTSPREQNPFACLNLTLIGCTRGSLSGLKAQLIVGDQIAEVSGPLEFRCAENFIEGPGK